jgi:pimeloyl-ACP methyl ester carboxylesterase
MTDTQTHASTVQGHVVAGDVELWVDQRGTGPDVLLIAGLSDPAEAWTFQLDGLADHHRLTAFDNRGAGRSPMPPHGFTVTDMADDAAALLRSLGIEEAHVAGFSGGSATAQHLALRHPELVRSLVLVSTWARMDAFAQSMIQSFKWLADVAPSERQMLEAFFLWIYTARAHEDGTVDAIIDEALAFPHPQSPEAFVRQLEAWEVHDTVDRLGEIAVPTLVVAGDEDIITPVRLGRVVADGIPGAELVLLEGEAHQPFQESPESFNELVLDFWSRVEGRR